MECHIQEIQLPRFGCVDVVRACLKSDTVWTKDERRWTNAARFPWSSVIRHSSGASTTFQTVSKRFREIRHADDEDYHMNSYRMKHLFRQFMVGNFTRCAYKLFAGVVAALLMLLLYRTTFAQSP